MFEGVLNMPLIRFVDTLMLPIYICLLKVRKKYCKITVLT